VDQIYLIPNALIKRGFSDGINRNTLKSWELGIKCPYEKICTKLQDAVNKVEGFHVLQNVDILYRVRAQGISFSQTSHY